VFELFDRNSSGYIKKHEVTSIAIKLGFHPGQGMNTQQNNNFVFSVHWNR
jgi:Ca2+-binding EF-hand superfamily protein